MKRLNIKLLVFLGVGFLVSAVGLRFLWGYQVNKNADSLLARANSATEPAEEIRLLKRYLQYRREDLTELKRLLRLGKEHAVSGNRIQWKELGRVQQTLERAVRENPKDIDLQEQFMELAYQMGRTNDATGALETLEELGALQPKHKVIWASCFARENRNDEAIAKLSELLGYDSKTESFDVSNATAPQELDAYVMLRALIQARVSPGDRRLPTLIANQMVEQNKDNADAFRLRAGYLRTTVQDNPEALQLADSDIEKALSLAPDDEDVIVDAVRIKLNLGDKTRAKELLATGMEKHPDNRRIYEFLSILDYMDNDLKGSIEKLNIGLQREALKLNPFLMWIRADRELDIEDSRQAKETLNRIKERLPKPYTDFLVARMQMASGDYAGAAKILDRLRPDAAGLPFNIPLRINGYLGACYRQMGQEDKLIELGSNDDESSVATQLRQAASFLKVGKIGQAGKIYQDIFKDPKSKDDVKGSALIGMYNVSIAQQKLRPKAQRNWEQVDKLVQGIIQHLKRQKNGQTLVPSFMASSLIDKGQNQKAKEFLEQGIQQQRGNFSLWQMLHTLTNNNERGLKLLSQMEQIFGDLPDIRVSKAKRFALINGPNAESELAALVDNMDAYKPFQQIAIRRVVAEQFAVLGNYPKAIEMYREAKANSPSDVRSTTALFDIAVMTDDEKLMDEMLEDYEKSVGEESAEWKVAAARKMLWQIKTERVPKTQVNKVRSLLESAEAKRRDWAAITEFKAETFAIEGNIDEAVRVLSTAFTKNPSNYIYPRKIASLLSKAGRHAEAKQYVDILPAHLRSTGDLLTELQMLTTSDPKAALERILPLLKENPDSPELLSMLAGAYDRLGATDKTIVALRKLTQVAAQQRSTWLNYVSYLNKQNKTTEATQALAEIEKNMVDESELALTMGQCSAVLNRYDDAKKWYRQAHKIAPNDTVIMRNIAQLAYATGDLETGEDFFDRILGVVGSDPETTKNQAWCRREKAKVLAATQTFQDFQEAIRLLEKNADEFGKLGNEDLQYWLTMHANRPERVYREKALNRLLSLKSSRRLTAFENMIQAELNKLEGRWPDARDIMLELLSQQPSNQYVVAKYVGWLIERKEINKAANWLSKLDPKSGDYIRLNSIVLVLQGKSKQAAQQLLALVPKNPTKEESGKLREVAMMFTELGQHNAQFYGLASKQWQRYVRMNPESMMGYVQFLMNVPGEKGIASGLKRANENVKKAIAKNEWPTVLKYAALGIEGLQSHKDGLTANSPHVKMIRDWLTKAGSVASNQVDVLWNEAMLADLLNDESTLETNYRRLMEMNETSDIRKGIAANNLAYLLATTNRGGEAVKVIDGAFEILGQTSDLRDTRAMAFIAMGQYRDAINDLTKIIKAGEGTAQIYFHLAVAETKNGDTEKARRNINKALEQGLEASELGDREADLFKSLIQELQITLPTSSVSG